MEFANYTVVRQIEATVNGRRTIVNEHHCTMHDIASARRYIETISSDPMLATGKPVRIVECHITVGSCSAYIAEKNDVWLIVANY